MIHNQTSAVVDFMGFLVYVFVAFMWKDSHMVAYIIEHIMQTMDCVQQRVFQKHVYNYSDSGV
jgi:hypothetical protein